MIIYDGAKAVTDMNQLSDSRCLEVGWDESHYEIFPISRVQSGNEQMNLTVLQSTCHVLYKCLLTLLTRRWMEVIISLRSMGE